MKRRTRSGRRVNTQYKKREISNETVSHFIVFPVTLSTIGKSNDFLFRSLSLCWNDKSILKDSRCMHMIRGFNLITEVDVEELDKSAETGWFSSSRSNDLRKIGNVAGYFIRNNACSVAVAMDKEFVPGCKPINNKEFNDFVGALKDEKAIVPVIVQLDISPDSYFDWSKFVYLNENFARHVVYGQEMKVTRRAKILNIKPELHEWAWRLLNTPTFEGRQKLINIDLINETCLECQNETRPQIEYRSASSRNKFPSKRYPSDIFITM